MDSVKDVFVIFIGVLLVAYTFPAAITALATATTTSWSTAAYSMWLVLQVVVGVAGLICVIAPAIDLVKRVF